MGVIMASPFGGQGFVLFARLALAAVFLMAGVAKLPQLYTFAVDVQKYRLLPSALARGYALTLPWLELVVAVSLFSGILAPTGAALALLLLLSFLVAVATAMVRRFDLNCQCFGLLYRERVGLSTLLRDGTLVLLALYVLTFDRGRFALPAVVSGLPQPSDLVALACTLAVLAVSLAVATLATRVSQSGSAVTPPTQVSSPSDPTEP